MYVLTGPARDFLLTADDAVSECIARGVSPRWSDRLRSMLRHASTVSGHVNGDNVQAGFVSLRVTSAGSWPVRGSITVVRADGLRFRLAYSGRDGFTVKAVA